MKLLLVQAFHLSKKTAYWKENQIVVLPGAQYKEGHLFILEKPIMVY